MDRRHLVWSATALCLGGKVRRLGLRLLWYHRWIPQCARLISLTVGCAQEGLRVLLLCCLIALKLVQHRPRLAHAVISKLTFLKRNQENDG